MKNIRNIEHTSRGSTALCIDIGIKVSSNSFSPLLSREIISSSNFADLFCGNMAKLDVLGKCDFDVVTSWRYRSYLVVALATPRVLTEIVNDRFYGSIIGFYASR